MRWLGLLVGAVNRVEAGGHEVEVADEGALLRAVLPSADRRRVAHLLTGFIDAGWITRTQGQRAVRPTDTGYHALRTRLGLDLPDA